MDFLTWATGEGVTGEGVTGHWGMKLREWKSGTFSWLKEGNDVDDITLQHFLYYLHNTAQVQSGTMKNVRSWAFNVINSELTRKGHCDNPHATFIPPSFYVHCTLLMHDRMQTNKEWVFFCVARMWQGHDQSHEDSKDDNG